MPHFLSINYVQLRPDLKLQRVWQSKSKPNATKFL